MTLDPRTVSLKGKRTATLQQALAYVPDKAFHKATVKAYLTELSRLAHVAGLDFAVLAAQSAEETDRWRSEVWRHAKNPAGMFNKNRSAYIVFTGGKTAAQAQIVQMCAYVYGSLPKALERYKGHAPRYDEAVKRFGGSVGNLSHLGNGHWAEDPDYATIIAQHLEAIRKGAPIPNPTPHASLAYVDLSHKVSNHFGRPFPPVAMVWHCTDDLTLDNTLSWFENDQSNASSNYVVARDGTIYRMVDPVTGSAWTNGDVKSPRTDIPWLNEAVKSGNNLNLYTITIETVATPSVPPTEQQYRSLIAIAAFETARFPSIGHNRSHQLRHADINGVDRAYCPGPHFDLARIIKAIGGDPTNMEN